MGKIKRLIMALLLAGSLLTGIAGTAGATPVVGGAGDTTNITNSYNTTSTTNNNQQYNFGGHTCQGGHNCGSFGFG
jgi:hypothetical protein